MDWQTVATVFGGASVALIGVIWHDVRSSLNRITDQTQEICRVVHGHGIRLDMIEGRDHGQR